MEEQQVVAMLNSPFNGFQVSDSHAPAKVIPFATTFGPTVFSCSKCGATFGDYNAKPSEEYSELIKKARNAHFVEHYNSDINGYPTKTSNHFSLHRAIQIVMRENFPNDIELKPEMVSKVASFLQKVDKGNYYRKEIERMIPEVIESYLQCLKQGQQHAPEFVSFHQRVLHNKEPINQVI